MTGLRSFVALGALALLPAVSHGQWRSPRRYSYHYHSPSAPSREATLAVGVLDYDFAPDVTFPMAALRFDWRLTRFLRSELSFAYALAQVERASGQGNLNVSLGAATVGLRAELPTPFVRPYVGAAMGLFGRTDNGGGDRLVRPTHAFPAGVRIALSDRVAVRGEARWRFDQHKNGATAVDVEKTAGLSFAF
jgi:opacity protein-like surface antigen